MIGSRVRRALSEGADPDPRFTLANERTFLAWLRSGIAFIAAGVGVDAVAPENIPATLSSILAAALMTVGGVIAADGFRRWLRTEQALRMNGALPVPVAVPVLSVLTGLIAGILVAAVVLQ
ncbi:YidH family protein [Parafrankia colletiae]|uniref:YidH family protein n=1 Tax=Parafrankia colletiae TaxID=573497 RepID=UPI000A0403B3